MSQKITALPFGAPLCWRPGAHALCPLHAATDYYIFSNFIMEGCTFIRQQHWIDYTPCPEKKVPLYFGYNFRSAWWIFIILYHW